VVAIDDAGPRLVAIGLGELATLQPSGERCLDATPAGLGQLVRRLDQPDLEIVAGTDLGDARSHHPAASDANAPDRHPRPPLQHVSSCNKSPARPLSA
jgi:hypothetical protein